MVTCPSECIPAMEGTDRLQPQRYNFGRDAPAPAAWPATLVRAFSCATMSWAVLIVLPRSGTLIPEQ
jgi:hypothetical protein